MTTPVPPPLPPILVKDPTHKLLNNNAVENDDQIETKIACKRLFREYSEPVLLSWNKKVTSVMQEGPSCGLAAMCMASQLVSTNKNILTLDQVFNYAKDRQFTCSGEMFSAANMCLLIQEMLGCFTELLSDGLDNRQKIIRHLSSGRSVLVPYDADKNHEPCCQKGHKAHWAVLTGAVFVLSSQMTSLTSSFIPDSSCQTLYHVNSTDDSSVNFLSFAKQSSLINNLTDLYVYAKQGKSQRLVAWKYTDLAQSNANLTEICPIRSENLERYKIPEEGISGGLRNQVILLESEQIVEN